jgi:DNA polymerase elongation subunit (family B)
VGIEELVISRRLTRPANGYKHASATAIAAKQLARAGVALRPGEAIEYILTDTDSNYADDRVRALTMWESWRGYDVNEYQRALREAFEALDHFAVVKRPSISLHATGPTPSTRSARKWRENWYPASH